MTTLNSILVLLVAVIAVFLESAFGGVRRLLGAQIDLLPAIMVYASLSAGLFTIVFTAVLGGLLFDSLSANSFGVSVLPLLAIGLAIWSQRDMILRGETFAQVVLGAAASAIAPALTVLLLLTKGKTPMLGWGSVWQWIVMAAGGGLATPALFKMFGLFDRSLNYQRASESTFRPDREIRRSRK